MGYGRKRRQDSLEWNQDKTWATGRSWDSGFLMYEKRALDSLVLASHMSLKCTGNKSERMIPGPFKWARQHELWGTMGNYSWVREAKVESGS